MKFKIRRDTAANWASANPTLASGEIGWDSTNKLVKIGDGSTPWASLAYLFGKSLSQWQTLWAHITRTDNPHNVTKAQLGVEEAIKLQRLSGFDSKVDWYMTWEIDGGGKRVARLHMSYIKDPYGYSALAYGDVCNAYVKGAKYPTAIPNYSIGAQYLSLDIGPTMSTLGGSALTNDYPSVKALWFLPESNTLAVTGGYGEDATLVNPGTGVTPILYLGIVAFTFTDAGDMRECVFVPGRFLDHSDLEYEGTLFDRLRMYDQPTGTNFPMGTPTFTLRTPLNTNIPLSLDTPFSVTPNSLISTDFLHPRRASFGIGTIDALYMFPSAPKTSFLGGRMLIPDIDPLHPYQVGRLQMMALSNANGFIGPGGDEGYINVTNSLYHPRYVRSSYDPAGWTSHNIGEAWGMSPYSIVMPSQLPGHEASMPSAGGIHLPFVMPSVNISYAKIGANYQCNGFASMLGIYGSQTI